MRLAVLLVVGLGGLGCALNAEGLGTTETDLVTTDASTTMPPIEGTTTSGMGSSTASPPTTDTTGPSSATDGTTTHDTTDDTTTGSMQPPLIDEGLLARWYVDEAAEDQRPTHVLDSQPPAVDLALMYDNGSPSYTTIDDNRGLRWADQGLSGRPQAPIGGTKLLDQLGGATQATFELVLAAQSFDPEASRFIHFGSGGGSGDFVIAARNADELEVRWPFMPDRKFDASFDGSRQVLHVVVDTTLAAPEDRFRAYLDGVELSRQDANAPGQGSGMQLQGSSSVVLGNRSDGQRSFGGTLGYAAIYRVAFDPGDVQANAEALLMHDDAP